MNTLTARFWDVFWKHGRVYYIAQYSETLNRVTFVGNGGVFEVFGMVIGNKVSSDEEGCRSGL